MNDLFEIIGIVVGITFYVGVCLGILFISFDD